MEHTHGRFYGTVPTPTHLRAFGSVAWVLQAPINLHALTSRVHEGEVVVGYPEPSGSKQYLVLEVGKIVHSRNVVFDKRPPDECTPVAPQAVTQHVARPAHAPVVHPVLTDLLDNLQDIGVQHNLLRRRICTHRG